MPDIIDDKDALEPRPSPESLKAAFMETMREMGENAHGLAVHFKQLGDHRPIRTIERSLNRAISGEIKIPGELVVISQLLVRIYRRAVEDVTEVTWEVKMSKSGLFTEAVFGVHRGWDITLSPQTKNRWMVTLRLPSGFSPSWPAWQPSLPAAKIKALMYADHVMNEASFVEIAKHARKADAAAARRVSRG